MFGKFLDIFKTGQGPGSHEAASLAENRNSTNSLATNKAYDLEKCEIVEFLADGEYGPLSLMQVSGSPADKFLLRGTYAPIARALTREMRQRLDTSLTTCQAAQSQNILHLQEFRFEPDAVVIYQHQEGKLLHRMLSDDCLVLRERLALFDEVVKAFQQVFILEVAQLKMIDPKRIWVSSNNHIRFLLDANEWPEGMACSIGEIEIQREARAEDFVFAAPEQLLQTGRLGCGVEATYQYRLGVLFFKLVLGRNPFGSEPEMLKLMARGSVRPRATSPSTFHRELAPLDGPVLKLLEKASFQRFGTIDEAIAELLQASQTCQDAYREASDPQTESANPTDPGPETNESSTSSETESSGPASIEPH